MRGVEQIRGASLNEDEVWVLASETTSFVLRALIPSTVLVAYVE